MTDWDASAYERVSDPQLEWGRRVLGRLRLRGDETALDAGCGTGRVTRLLAERLPRGRVLGVDASPAMIDEARGRLADLGGRVEVRRADLLELRVDAPVDVVVSTATFHWIADHDRLFARLASAMRPGARLVAQCGGAGNVARTLAAAEEVGSAEPYAAALRDMPAAWNFADPAETVARLEGAGLAGARAWLEESPARFGTEEAVEYLATVVLRCHLARLPQGLREPFAREVAERCRGAEGRVEVDYVRLNLEAWRPGAGAEG